MSYTFKKIGDYISENVDFEHRKSFRGTYYGMEADFFPQEGKWVTIWMQLNEGRLSLSVEGQEIIDPDAEDPIEVSYIEKTFCLAEVKSLENIIKWLNGVVYA